MPSRVHTIYFIYGLFMTWGPGSADRVKRGTGNEIFPVLGMDNDYSYPVLSD
jgi:hypothetical protein